MRDQNASPGPPLINWQKIALAIVIVAGLLFARRHSFLLFHVLAEGFSIVVACAIFMFAWSGRRLLDNHYMTLVGIGYLFVAVVDTVHLLAYQGMTLIAGASANHATQLWISGRYLESLTLLVAPWFLTRQLRIWAVFLGYALATILILLTILVWQMFPDCFVDGQGATIFNKGSEYLICLFLIGAMYGLDHNKSRFETNTYQLLFLAMGSSIASELSLTLHTLPYDYADIVGHLLKIISFTLVYMAIIDNGLRKPLSLLCYQLQESKERLQLILDSTEEAIYGVNLQGNCTFCNTACLLLLGYTHKKQLLDQNTHMLFHYKHADGHEFPLAECRMNQALQEGRCVHVDDEVFWRQDGSSFAAEYYSHPILVNKTVQGAVVSFTDITSRKESEEKQQRNHRCLQALWQLSTMVETSTETRIDFVMRQGVDLTRSEAGFICLLNEAGDVLEHFVCAENMVERSNLLDKPPNSLLTNACLWAEAIRTGEPVTVNASAAGHSAPQVTDGHGALHNYLVVPMTTDKRVVAVAGVVNKAGDYDDFDRQHLALLMQSAWEQMERQRHLQILRANEKRYRAMVEQQVDYVCRFRADGTITFVNQALCALLDRKPEDLLGRNYRDTMDNVTAESMHRSLQAITPLTPCVPHEQRLDLPDGNTVWQHWINHGIFDEQGTLLEYQGVGRDITEHKANEHRLEEAKRAAEVANMAKGEFLANVSHELRTPMNSIIGMNYLLQEAEPNTKQREYLAEQAQAATILREMLDNILEFSTVEQSDMPTMREQFKLHDLLSTMIDQAIARKHISRNRFRIKIGRGVPAILTGEPRHYGQVLKNLLDNAVKFT